MAGSQKDLMLQKPFLLINYKASSFSSPFSVSDRPKFLAFSKKKKKKGNDVVKPFFTWNNSFNLKNEHITAQRKTGTKTGTFFTVYCAFR